MNNEFRFLRIEEVVELDKENQYQVPGGQCLIRGQHLYEKLEEDCGIDRIMLTRGLDCQILSPGQSWQKGKLKLAVIFYPDEEESIESPTDSPLEQDSLLDELRQMRFSDQI